MENSDKLSTYDKLLKKIHAYFLTIWKDKHRDGIQEQWLENFKHSNVDMEERERDNMLYLLSKFMYFGDKELRHLLLVLYRDLFKYPIISSIRKLNSDTTDYESLNELFKIELEKTKFLGVGNPSESGVHMLYYFRQECKLPKKHFISTNEIITTSVIQQEDKDGIFSTTLKSEIKDTTIKRYIFIDDFCGSGSQAKDILENFIGNIKSLDPMIEVNYLMLFGTELGIENVRKLNIFNRVEAVFTIDDTFKAFSDTSRYFNDIMDDPLIEKKFSKGIANKYGKLLSDSPLGYRDGQLLVGFHHNTPDNSLPILWCENLNWKPIFKRYNKI